MPQQLFPFSYTLGPVNRVGGAFPLSFYSMAGVMGNHYTLLYSPQSNWGGAYKDGMLLAGKKERGSIYEDGTLLFERKEQIGIMHRQSVANRRRKEGMLSKQLLAGHDKVMAMIPSANIWMPSDRVNKSKKSVLEPGSTMSRINKTKRALLTAQAVMSHSNVRRAHYEIQPIMSHSNVRRAHYEVQSVMSHSHIHRAHYHVTTIMKGVIRRTADLMDTILNSMELKPHEVSLDDGLLKLSHLNKRDAQVYQETLDVVRIDIYDAVIQDDLNDTNYRKTDYRSVVEQGPLENRYGNRDITKSSTVETQTEAAVKADHTSLMQREVILAVLPYIQAALREDYILGKRQEHHSYASEDVILAKVHRALFGTEMQLTVEGFIDPRLGHLLSEDPLGLDALKSSRPAMGDLYDVPADILDSYTQIWNTLPDHDERTDLMIIPSRDFPYKDNADKLMDENGVPLDPLSDSSIADVQVRYPLDHPFPAWAELGDKEMWVKLTYLKGMILSIIQIWRSAKMKLAGMTMLEGMNYLLDEYYNQLQGFGDMVSLEQYRVFRLGRWFAERIIMHDSAILLHREYEQWSDKLYMDGDMNAPVILDSFMISPDTGVMQTVSPYGEVNLTVTNYINGEFSMSASVPSGTESTTLTVYVDGDIKRVLTVGQTLRMKIPVNAGTHRVRITWTGDSGQALLSGFVLTGAVFVGATTSFKDPKDLQGNMAVHRLIADMMKYYHDHWDQQKNKGSKGIRQRKPWLTI